MNAGDLENENPVAPVPDAGDTGLIGATAYVSIVEADGRARSGGRGSMTLFGGQNCGRTR